MPDTTEPAPPSGHWHIRLVDGEPERVDCEDRGCPMNVSPCRHPADRRCFDCATDDELAAAIPVAAVPSPGPAATRNGDTTP
jgi:hypothetical protein